MPNYHTVRINQSAKQALKILTDRHQKTEVEFASKSILYIHKTGIDPYTKAIASTPDLIKNLENRMISFLKKRESDFFVPMKEGFHKMVEEYVTLMDNLNTLDVVQFSSQKREETTQQIKPNFKVPQGGISESQKEEEKIKNPSTDITQDIVLENLKGALDKAVKESELYKGELQNLVSKISRGSSLGTARFNIQITEQDLVRIKGLL